MVDTQQSSTMSFTFAIIIYDPCPDCECPMNPHHEKNGCSQKPKKVKKIKLVVVEEHTKKEMEMLHDEWQNSDPMEGEDFQCWLDCFSKEDIIKMLQAKAEHEDEEDEDEEDEDEEKCNACGEPTENEDGVTCQTCAEFTCDECIISDADDQNCSNDECTLCSESRKKECEKLKKKKCEKPKKKKILRLVEEYTEYEIEYCNIEDEGEPQGVEHFDNKETAVARWKELVAEDEYDAIDLVERCGVNADGCCQSSDQILEHRKEGKWIEDEEE
mgnify:CR=1 FL=1